MRSVSLSLFLLIYNAAADISAIEAAPPHHNADADADILLFRDATAALA